MVINFAVRLIALNGAIAVLSGGPLHASSIVKHWGVYSTQGGRPAQEDAWSVLDNNSDGVSADTAFFGVYDGHRGAAAAQIAAQELGTLMVAGSEKPTHDRIREAFERCNNIIGQQSPAEGTCALVALQEHNELHLAWAGDCRALVFKENMKELPYVTLDHKVATNAVERQRIIQAGGTIKDDAYLKFQAAGLSCSRSLGNNDVKAENPDVMLTTPDIMPPIDLKGAPTFAVLATDGLWDILSPKEVRERIPDILKNPTRWNAEAIVPHTDIDGGSDDSCKHAAHVLVSLAYRRFAERYNKPHHRCDNITAMVIRFVDSHHGNGQS